MSANPGDPDIVGLVRSLTKALRDDFRPTATCIVTGRKFRPIKTSDETSAERRQAADLLEHLLDNPS